MHRPQIQALLDKTTVDMRPDIPANFEEMWVAVRVETTDGQTYVSRCNRPRGIWGNPLTREERLAKVRSCASRTLPDAQINVMIETVENMENADSNRVQALIAALGDAPSG